MAAIHTQSAAIFGAKNVNVSEEKVAEVDYVPINCLTPNTVIEFTIPGTSDWYVSLKETRLHVVCKVKLTKFGKEFAVKKPRVPIGYKGSIIIDKLPSQEPESESQTQGETLVNLNLLTGDEREAAVKTFEDHVLRWNRYVSLLSRGGVEASAIPIDAILHTMWSGVDVFMNHQLVSTTNTMYAYKSYIETVVNNSAATKLYQLGAIGFTGNQMDGESSKGPELDPTTRTLDMNKRAGLIPVNTTVDLIGYLSSDLWGIDAAIVNGVEINIKLYPHKEAFRLMTFSDGTEAELEIEKIYLKVIKKRLAPKIVVAHNHVMRNVRVASYPFVRTEVRSFNFPEGSRGVTLENPYQSNIPARIIVGMVRADSKAGSFRTNPLHFQHFNIMSAGFYLNDEPVPRRPYQLDPRNKRIADTLADLYRTLGKSGIDRDIGLSREEYLNGTFLLPFDVQPTASGDLQLLAKRTAGHCRLELLFREPLPCNICVITYAIFPAMLEIDFARNVKVVDLEKPVRTISHKPLEHASVIAAGG